MHRVFLIEDTDLDISGLREYGTLTYLFNDSENRRSFQDEKLDEQIISQFSRANFDPDKDYIAIVGKLIPVTITMTAVVSTYGCVKALAFDARTSQYVERELGKVTCI